MNCAMYRIFYTQMCTCDNVQRLSSLTQTRVCHLNHKRSIHTDVRCGTAVQDLYVQGFPWLVQIKGPVAQLAQIEELKTTTYVSERIRLFGVKICCCFHILVILILHLNTIQHTFYWLLHKWCHSISRFEVHLEYLLNIFFQVMILFAIIRSLLRATYKKCG